MSEPISPEEELKWAEITYRMFIEAINSIGPTEHALLTAMARVFEHVLAEHNRAEALRLIDRFAATLRSGLDDKSRHN